MRPSDSARSTSYSRAAVVVRGTVVAVDAVHRAPLGPGRRGFLGLEDLRVARRHVGELDLVDRLAARVGEVADLVVRVDVPVDAVRRAACLAAHLHHQRGLELGVLLVVRVVRAHLEALADELGRPVALFAGAARRAQRVHGRRDRARVQVERDCDQLPGARDLRLHEPLGARADVAAGAADAHVRRALEGGVLGLHDLVAGHAAELGRVHVVDGLEGQAGGQREHRHWRAPRSRAARRACSPC